MCCSFSELTENNVQQLFTNGADCEGMANMYCPTMIGGWTVGYQGTCMYGANYGVRIGRSSYKMGLIEVNYSNFII